MTYEPQVIHSLIHPIPKPVSVSIEIYTTRSQQTLSFPQHHHHTSSLRCWKHLVPLLALDTRQTITRYVLSWRLILFCFRDGWISAASRLRDASCRHKRHFLDPDWYWTGGFEGGGDGKIEWVSVTFSVGWKCWDVLTRLGFVNEGRWRCGIDNTSIGPSIPLN